MKPIFAILGAIVLFAAGDASARQADAPAPGSVAATPHGVRLVEGGACAAEIARYREIVDSDGATGNVARRVYERIKVEIAAAERECSAGDDAKARALLLASKQRHGYPTGL